VRGSQLPSVCTGTDGRTECGRRCTNPNWLEEAAVPSQQKPAFPGWFRKLGGRTMCVLEMLQPTRYGVPAPDVQWCMVACLAGADRKKGSDALCSGTIFRSSGSSAWTEGVQRRQHDSLDRAMHRGSVDPSGRGLLLVRHRRASGCILGPSPASGARKSLTMSPDDSHRPERRRRKVRRSGHRPTRGGSPATMRRKQNHECRQNHMQGVWW
jgi:hypothetical protein